MGALEVGQEYDDSGATLTLRGDLDFFSSPLLRERIASLVHDVGQVTIDLGGIEFMDSTGLADLVWAHSEARTWGWTFSIQSPSATVCDLMARTGLDRVLPVE